MKKLISIAILMGITACAWAYGGHNINNSFNTATINTTNVNETINSDEDRFGYGIGADVIVFENPSPWVRAISVDYRHDFDNGEDTVFGVAHINLYEALGGK